jgi:hypothetical protein|tara:strand:- start:650 stop:1879 length:1230 start_codon:yes stop_codon:yes gene_type:complete
MSNSIQLANTDFTFSKLTLANPQGLQGGAYFSKLRVGEEPVLIQTPKCYTKNGIHKTEKKMYCDLMFTEENNNFIQWVYSLETTVKNLIYEKRSLWFHNDMDLDSIDYHWQNLLRTYKGKKSLLRCFINKSKGLNRGHKVQIYNEEEEELKLEDVDKTTKMICILEVVGLKFTSQSFQIEFGVKQMMLIKEKPLFSKCLIKFKSPTLNNSKEKDEQQEDSGAESDISIEDVEETKHTVPDKIIDSTEIEHDVEETANNIASEVAETNKDNVHVNVENNEEDKETTVAINTTSIDLSQNNISHFKDNLEKVVEKVVEKDELVIVQEESLDKNGIMNEIEILAPGENTDIVKLKNPNEVYMEIYKQARRKAKEAKKHAIQSYLEAKRIKSLYLLDEIESSDDDMEFEEYQG